MKSLNPSDSIQLTYFSNRLDSAVKHSNKDSLFYFAYQKALLCKQANNLKEWMRTYNELNKFYRDVENEYDSANMMLDSVFLLAWRQPRDTAEQNQQAHIYLSRAFNFKQLGQYTEAQKCYETANALYLETNTTYPRLATTLYQPWANIYTRYGDYEKAINMLQKAAGMMHHTNDNDREAKILCDLSIAYNSNRETEKAKKVLSEALQLNNLKPKTELVILSGLAETELFAGNYAGVISSQNPFEAAYKTWRVQNDFNEAEGNKYSSAFHQVLAIAQYKTGKYAAAEINFNKAIDFAGHAYAS
ncbi:MAG: tetratricopeptide repeat protein, partial [Chitinophagales bacterium]|nr:tetratricopeptide repeat protein [Chitinophagales bacterium]